MDPTTWPMWAKVLAGWGPLGAWAGIMTWAYLKTQRVQATRDLERERERLEREREFEAGSAAQAKRFADVVAALNRETRDQLVSQGQSFASEVRAQSEAHRAQEDELVERLLTTTEKHGETTGRLTEKVVKLAESLKKRQGGGDDGSST